MVERKPILLTHRRLLICSALIASSLANRGSTRNWKSNKNLSWPCSLNHIKNSLQFDGAEKLDLFDCEQHPTTSFFTTGSSVMDAKQCMNIGIFQFSWNELLTTLLQNFWMKHAYSGDSVSAKVKSKSTLISNTCDDNHMSKQRHGLRKPLQMSSHATWNDKLPQFAHNFRQNENSKTAWENISASVVEQTDIILIL